MKKFLLFLLVFFCTAGSAFPSDRSAGRNLPAQTARPAVMPAPEKTPASTGGVRTVAAGRLYPAESGFDSDESGFSADERLFLEFGYSSGRADAYGQAGRWQFFGTYDMPVQPAWLIGLGCGVLYYPHLKKGFMPVYADVRFNFTPHSRRTPFIDLKVGYAFLLRERDRYDEYGDYDDFYFDRIGGVFFSPSIGAQVFRFKGFALSVSAGYSFHKIDYRDLDDRHVERIGGFHFLVGLEF